MANPQKENGFTAIANELLEAFMRFPMADEPRRVFLAILRKTYGYQKKEDKIPLSQLAQITGITQPHICRALIKLRDLGMIDRDAGGKTKIKKDYSVWAVPNQAVPNGAIGSAQPGTATSAQPGTLKRKVKKLIKRKMKHEHLGSQQVATNNKVLNKEITEPMNEQIDRSFPRKRLYGDEAFNWLLDYFEYKFDRPILDQEKWSRIYLKHLKTKIGLGKVREMIEWASDPDCWWYSRLTGIKMLYYKRDVILTSMEADKKEIVKKEEPNLKRKAYEEAYFTEHGFYPIL